jgi:hypothetical protein
MLKLEYPLRGRDIEKIVKKTNIIEYKTLYNINQLDDLFINDSCVLLYRSSPDTAHWCCLLRNSHGVEFFDPYGELIDSQIDQVESANPKYANNYYKGDKQLIKLLIDSPYNDLSYNEFRLQKEAPSINTCGRHVAVRLLYKHLSLEEYVSHLLERYPGQSPDQIVLQITNKYFRT